MGFNVFKSGLLGIEFIHVVDVIMLQKISISTSLSIINQSRFPEKILSRI